MSNPDEVRAYLASKPQLGHLTQVSGWKANEALAVATNPAKNTSTQVLSNTAVANIKQEATELLLNRLINKANNKNLLSRLTKVKDKSGLKQVAVALGLPATAPELNWIKEDELNDLKEQARIRLFNLRVAEASPLGLKAHPKLVDGFAQRDTAQQEELLQVQDEFHQLLRAQDSKAFKHYLGFNLSEDWAQEIMLENNRLIPLNAIHNAAVARALAYINPALSLDSDAIVAINQTFTGLNPTAFTDPLHYKNWVDSY